MLHTSIKIIPIWNLLETALLSIMPGILLYFSPFPNACRILKTNVTQKKTKITSLILKSTYSVLTTRFKSTVLLLKSSCGDGIQLEGTCGCPLPMGTRETPSPAWGLRGCSATFLPTLYPQKGKTGQSWVNVFKASRWQPALPCRVQCTHMERISVQNTAIQDSFLQVGHMPSTLCLNDPENIFT